MNEFQQGYNKLKTKTEALVSFIEKRKFPPYVTMTYPQIPLEEDGSIEELDQSKRKEFYDSISPDSSSFRWKKYKTTGAIKPLGPQTSLWTFIGLILLIITTICLSLAIVSSVEKAEIKKEVAKVQARVDEIVELFKCPEYLEWTKWNGESATDLADKWESVRVRWAEHDVDISKDDILTILNNSADYTHTIKFKTFENNLNSHLWKFVIYDKDKLYISNLTVSIQNSYSYELQNTCTTRWVFMGIFLTATIGIEIKRLCDGSNSYCYALLYYITRKNKKDDKEYQANLKEAEKYNEQVLKERNEALTKAHQSYNVTINKIFQQYEINKKECIAKTTEIVNEINALSSNLYGITPLGDIDVTTIALTTIRNYSYEVFDICNIIIKYNCQSIDDFTKVYEEVKEERRKDSIAKAKVNAYEEQRRAAISAAQEAEHNMLMAEESIRQAQNNAKMISRSQLQSQIAALKAQRNSLTSNDPSYYNKKYALDEQIRKLEAEMYKL